MRLRHYVISEGLSVRTVKDIKKILENKVVAKGITPDVVVEEELWLVILPLFRIIKKAVEQASK